MKKDEVKTTLCKRDDLIKILKENRAKHVEDFREACIGYRLELAAKIKDSIDKHRDALKSVQEAQDTDLPSAPGYVSWPPMPKSHERSYDLQIRKLELEQRDTVELEDIEFAKFVMDDWEWKNEFQTTTANYAAIAKAGK
jgi:hypothetical protein